MPLITFQPLGKQVNAKEGDDLISLLKEAEIDLEYECGGKGTCGKCMVKIELGKVTSDKLDSLTKKEIDDGYVYACRAVVGEDDVVVQIPDQSMHSDKGQSEIVDDEELIQQDSIPANIEYNTLVAKRVIQVPPPQMQDGLSDIDRLTRKIQTEWEYKNVECPLSVIRSAADIIRQEKGKIAVTYVNEADCCHIIGLDAGDTSLRLFGIAVDIGTTTVAVKLYDLSQGKAIGLGTNYNSQIKCGADIISRINYAGKP